MKHSIIVVLTVFSITFSFDLKAQNKKGDKIQKSEFVVLGNCGMCKKRIENAALIKGVKMVDWDKVNKKMVVVFRTDKTDLSTIQKAISEIGHAADTISENRVSYNNLPGCCQYRDAKCDD